MFSKCLDGMKMFKKKMGEVPSFRTHEPGVDNGWGWKKFCDNTQVQKASALTVQVKVWVTTPKIDIKENQVQPQSRDGIEVHFQKTNF